MIFTTRLPVAFAPENMDAGISKDILIGENIFRAIIFLLPIFFKIDLSKHVGKLGLAIYIVGSLIYFASWIIVMYAPSSAWSNSVFGFAAPAYTPIIWLIGISLMADSYNVKIPFGRWHYIIPCAIFIGLHTTHSVLAYLRTS